MAGERVEDCIFALGDDWFLVRVRFAPDDERTKKIKGIRNARKWRDERKAERGRGGAVSPRDGAITFEKYASEWTANRVGNKAYGTNGKVESILRIHAFPRIGGKPLHSIRRSDITTLVATMNRTLAPVTVRNNYSYVASVFDDAVRDKRIAETPCVGIDLPPDKRRSKELVPIERADVRHIAETMAAEWQGAVVLAAGTGLRPGELFGLTVDRVDFLRRTVKVDRQVQTGRGGVYLCDLKTKASYRTVPMSARTAELLSQHLAAHPPVTLRLPDGPPPVHGEQDVRKMVEADFLFGTRTFARDAMSRAWRDAIGDLDMPDRSGWHALRHFYASVLIAGGESVKVVQARMGHKSATETLDTYGHLWPDNHDTTRAIVDEAMGAIFDGDVEEGEQQGERSPSVPLTPRKAPSRSTRTVNRPAGKRAGQPHSAQEGPGRGIAVPR